MSQKVKCPVCSVDYDIRGFPTHLATKHPSEFAKNNGITATANNTGNVSLEDSGKLKADIVILQDSVKTKDIELAEMGDSIRQKDAEFATLHDEIATLNDKNKYLESNEYLKTYLLKLTEEAYDTLGQQLGFVTGAPLEDSLKDEMYQVLRAVQVSLSDDKYYQEFKPLIKNVDAVLAKAEKHVTKLKDSTQGGATAARGAHNAEVASSTLAPATTAPAADVEPVETKETTTAPVVAPVADSKPVEEPSIVFHEVKDAGWTWYPALGYSIKN